MQVNQEDRIAPQERPAGANALAIVAIVVVLLLCGGAYYYFSSQEPVEPEMVEVIELPDIIPNEPLITETQIPEVIIEAEPVIVEEVVIAPQVEPLPKLSESDEFVNLKTIEMADGMKIEPLMVEKDLVRHFVVFVDNLAQGELARKVSPLKAPNRVFTVSEITNKTYLNPDSYHRYDLYADFVSNLNEEQLTKTYKELTPLLSQAFEELGYGDMDFNDRMVEAIDIMLDAPIIDSPIELDGVSVNYQFVDPQLESLPNAQKLLIRMGPENSKKVKAALRKLKKNLAE
ncbi:DUF3014 domain-containing protein [Shewanella sp. D64]|uniref:DUF3014 domain-containing protein n=1 Tax=unclassified Shewanella TaxID=196818 RepID=UPI0022BA52FC|nr:MULTISPECIES: DUF3014 domain-containing protein [unclassified Shewanella]MEC4726846.1 DUF3014 domain-containing protein [Shewanella sp. D64]MEC4739042.1 DUF3014 domain-containing protein [Shewanella sp. E94]WBJ95900.1 DUF3014 domain-containing protein [Shewanella sp. MTB7]